MMDNDHSIFLFFTLPNQKTVFRVLMVIKEAGPQP